MKTVRFLGLTLIALTLSFAVGLASARACTCVPSLTSSLSGAVDVPLDVAPILRGYVSGPIQWTAQDGSEVAFDERSGAAPRQCPGPDRELRPRALLAPNTAYSIRAKLNNDDDAEITFTTGASRVSELPLPKPTLSVTLVHRRIYDSCVSEVNGCLAVGAAQTEVTVFDPRGNELNWFMVQGELNWEKIGNEVGCIEARTRNAAGQRSEPLRLCGAELAVREPFKSDYENSYLRCTGGRIPSLLDPDAAVAWPSDAGASNAQAAPATNVTDGGASDGATGTTQAPATAANTEAATAAEPDDGCSVAGGTGSGALFGLLAVFAGLRRRRSRS
jgi:MYXO-CTERM domain-containing protein